MKLTKLMLSASIAALALVSCNKQDTTPTPTSNRLKSIEISLENVVFTKGLAGNPVSHNQKITVKNFQIFLTDAAGNDYSAKTANGAEAAQSYWTTEQLASGLPVDASFHYVDPNCTKIVAVANLNQPYASYSELKDALANDPVAIDLQQNQNELALYDESTEFVLTTSHNDLASDGTTYMQEAYRVELVLKPRISRFEVDGFSVIPEDPTAPKYNQIKVTQLAFQNYYPTVNLFTGEEGGELVTPILDFSNQAAVYTWLDTPWTGDLWYRDAFELTLTSSNDYLQDLPANNKLAYHAFSGSEVPVFVIKLEVDGQPAYLYTKNLTDTSTGESLKALEEGKIYRMSGEGEIPGNKGTIEIPENKIDPMDRCLDIKVDVSSWEVVLVQPEF